METRYHVVVFIGLALCTSPSCSGPQEEDTHVEPDRIQGETPRCGDDLCADGEDCPRDCIGIEWVQLEGGRFAMGSDAGPPGERPVHDVTVASFELMTQEVTTRAYRACVEARACTEPVLSSSDELAPHQYCTWLHDDRNDHPVNCITWEQARSFCTWLGARLPTEAEWEFAARGRGGDATYPWGNQLPTCELAVMGTEPYFVGCGEERTFPVCSRPRGNTPQGLCDMAGSVIEWVEDEGHETYEGAPTDGSAWIDSESPETRVARGGSLATRDPAFLRSTVRFLFDPAQPRYVLGLRCAR